MYSKTQKKYFFNFMVLPFLIFYTMILNTSKALELAYEKDIFYDAINNYDQTKYDQEDIFYDAINDHDQEEDQLDNINKDVELQIIYNKEVIMDDQQDFEVNEGDNVRLIASFERRIDLVGDSFLWLYLPKYPKSYIRKYWEKLKWHPLVSIVNGKKIYYQTNQNYNKNKYDTSKYLIDDCIKYANYKILDLQNITKADAGYFNYKEIAHDNSIRKNNYIAINIIDKKPDVIRSNKINENPTVINKLKYLTNLKLFLDCPNEGSNASCGLYNIGVVCGMIFPIILLTSCVVSCCKMTNKQNLNHKRKRNIKHFLFAHLHNKTKTIDD